jgi:hypothetical protein
LPGPIDTSEVFAILDQYGPNSFEDVLGNPALRRAVNGTVVPKSPRKLIPLTAGTHMVNDAVECLALAGPRPPGWRGRIELVEDVLNELPEFVIDLLDRRECFNVALPPGHPWLLI